MATTSKGFPYPLGTDRVMDGDDAIKALAQKVDGSVGLLASGVVTVTLSNAAQAFTAVTFPSGRFQSAPAVVATTASGTYLANAVSPTATGVNIYAAHRDGTAASGSVTVYWMARQE